ncbi:MAG: NYN domain-containing protein [Succinivibrio sp.]
MWDMFMDQIRTAILVDGGFYRKRAKTLWGEKSPKDRADELESYCHKHLTDQLKSSKDKSKILKPIKYLYRVFYYDCPWLTGNIYNPITKKNVNFGRTEAFQWAEQFYGELKHRRKFALRMGRLSETPQYVLKEDVLKQLFKGTVQFSELTEKDLRLNAKQKGVDMRIGIDITSLALKKQVDQIILIAGDSDFVPAAKLARREGIDFVLDPLWQPVADDLFEHIDGLQSFNKSNKLNKDSKHSD